MKLIIGCGSHSEVIHDIFRSNDIHDIYYASL